MVEQSVTSVDYQKAIGRFSREALRAPITITHHGRDSLVLMSVDEYRRLKRRDRQSLIMDDFTDADRALVAASNAPPEAKAFDHEIEE